MSVDLAQLALSVDANGFVRANKTMTTFNQTASNTEAQADKITRSTDRMATGMVSAERSLGLVKNMLLGIAGALSVHEIIAYADAWTNVENTLTAVTNSQKELLSTQAKVLQLSKDTFSSLDGTASLYSEITRSVSDLGINQERVLGVTRTINNLFLAGGKAASETAGAIRQLNQGLGAGALRGDEFNSVAEGAPRILDALSKSLGITKGELRDFAATGGITAELLIGSLESYSVEAQRAVDTTKRTFSQSAELAQTLAIEYAGASDAIKDFTSGAGAGLVLVAKNIDLIADAAALAAVIFGARFTGSIIASTSALIAQNAAAMRATVTMNAMGTVIARTTVLTNTMAVASRAAGASMALLGGPAGVALLAGAAIYYFATRASEAEKILEGLNPEVDGLAERFAALGMAQQKLARNELAAQIDNQKDKIAGLVEQLGSLKAATERDPNGFFSAHQRDLMIEVAAKIEAAQGKLASLQGQFDSVKTPDGQIQGFIDKISGLNEVMGYFITGNSVAQFSMVPATAAAEVEKVSEAYAKMSYEIQKQIDLKGDESESASLAYDIQKGAIKDITEAEAKKLVILHQTKEAMDAQKEASDAAKKSAEDLLKFIDDMDVDDLFSAIGDDPFAGLDDPYWVDVIKQGNDEFDALITSVDEFGGAWSRTGSVVADSIGSMIDMMDDYGSRIGDITKKEKLLATEKEKTYDAGKLKTIEKAEKKLASERASANISSYRQMAGAASEMFDEQSKARKTLHGLEMAFSAIEMAMSIQRSFLAAKEAVLTQAKGDPLTAWARMAAMAAAVAALGYAVGGGGGGAATSAADVQEAQGTGSVLGSNDKSESLVNSFDNFSDIAFDQLVELRGIRESLADFQGGIAQLSLGVSASGLADQKYFAFQGQSFDQTSSEGLYIGGSQSKHSEMRAALAPMQSQISDIFSFMNETLNAGVESLGLEFEQSISDYWIDIGKVSFQDMSAQEIEQELGAIFSQQADLITEFVVPAMKEYQQMGEGLFETLTRVAKEQAIFNDAMRSMGLSMEGVSSLMAIDMSQSIAKMMGGFENFTEKSSDYLENFFTDQEKLEMMQRSITETFSALNVEMPTSIVGFRNLVEGIDRTTTEGQRLFATLLEINPAFSEYIKMTRDAADAAFGNLEQSINAERALSTARLNTAKATEQAAQKEYSLAEAALKASFTNEIAIAKQVSNEKIGLLELELDAAKSIQSSASSALSGAASNLEDAIQAEQQASQDSIQAQIDGYRNVSSEAQAYADSLLSLSESLRSSIAGMSADSVELTMSRRRAAQGQVDAALSSARGGDFTAAMGLDLSALQNVDSLFKTQAERDYDIAVTQNKLLELAALSDSQASIEEMTYQAAERSALELEAQTQQLGSINAGVMGVSEAMRALSEAQAQASNIDSVVAGFEAQIAEEKLIADEQSKALQDQLDQLLGTGESILSIDDAINRFVDSKAQLETAQASLAVAQSMYDAEIAAYDQIIAEQTAIYNAALGIDASVKSVDVAIYDLSESLLSYAEISRQQQENLASSSNQQTIADAESAANEKAMADEISKLRAENQELQQKMADSLKKLEENSTRTLNLELLS